LELVRPIGTVRSRSWTLKWFGVQLFDSHCVQLVGTA
jgi:hypothetical protein